MQLVGIDELKLAGLDAVPRRDCRRDETDRQ